MAAVIDDLLKVPERENGGRTAYDRFDFQTAWGISKVIDLHKAGANYAVGFEFHDDLIELDDADSPTTAVFYQMKSLDSGHWTLSRILDRPVAGKKKQTLKASIAGKMFDNIKRFGAVVGKLVMVSNQPLSEAGAKYEEVPLATLDAADVTKFVTAMKLECRAFKEADHLGFFYYEQCRLGLGSYEDAVFGQVGMLLHDRNIDAKPRPVEMRLVNDLFGMSSGWVLDFSNRTFEEFFRQEVGIEIYDDAYGFIGTSKGKHLSAFLQVGQPAAVVKALTALWEYRQDGPISRGEKDPVNGGRERLNAVLQRLGGRPLPPDSTATSAAPIQPQHTSPSERLLQELEDEFARLHSMKDAAQARGYAFERFLKKWFDAWGLDARASFRLIGEQIDGSFEHRGTVYLIEAKWTNARTDAASLRSFQEKAGDGFEGTRGLFVSYSGFTVEGLHAFNAKRVILMDGMDVFHALRRRISLDEVIAAKFRRGTEERRPLIQVSELFPQ